MYWPECALQDRSALSIRIKLINLAMMRWYLICGSQVSAFLLKLFLGCWSSGVAFLQRHSETTIRAVSPCVEWWGNATETYESSRQKKETVVSWSKPAVVHMWVMRAGRDPHGLSMVGTIFYIHQCDCLLSTNGSTLGRQSFFLPFSN